MNHEPWEITYTILPLTQFKIGQHLAFKCYVAKNLTGVILAEFLGLESRNTVKLKCLKVLEPDWAMNNNINTMFPPDGIVKKRANKCFLWGKNSKDGWDRCHWFKNITDPVD